MNPVYVQIRPLTHNETYHYATSELGRYLGMIMPLLTWRRIDDEKMINNKNPLITLASFEDIGIKDEKIKDPAKDDAVYVDIDGLSGVIAGSNPRSVLMAVYRFLRELGCFWAYAGREGEYVPVKDVSDAKVKLYERASHRHRGISDCGGFGVKEFLDFVEWLPKLGYNSFFPEGFSQGGTIRGFYKHSSNPSLDGRRTTEAEEKAFDEMYVREVKKRGMLLHAVGHGWCYAPFDIDKYSGLTYEETLEKVPQEKLDLLAVVNGKRDFARNNEGKSIVYGTNLCYSNPNVRKAIVDSVVDYLREHPECDILQFWLSDGHNHWCECEECAKMTPTDHYIVMINELDDALNAAGIGTTVTFLLYYETNWAPKHEMIKNQDRFLLMLCPYTRHYGEDLSVEPADVHEHQYKLNRYVWDSTFWDSVAHLREWKKAGWHGENYSFEYHFWKQFNDDIGGYSLAKTIWHDVAHLKEHDIDGIMMCGTYRANLPSGLPVYMMGRTLWDNTIDFDKESEIYFKKVFGEKYGLKLRDYQKSISEYFSPEYMRGRIPPSDEVAANLRKAAEICREFRPTALAAIEEDDSHSKFWVGALGHTRFAELFALALAEKINGDPDVADSYRQAAQDFVHAHEEEYALTLPTESISRHIDQHFRELILGIHDVVRVAEVEDQAKDKTEEAKRKEAEKKKNKK